MVVSLPLSIQMGCMSAISKAAAALVSYPYQVVATRMREEPPDGVNPRYRGILQTTRTVVRESGLGALYGGLTAHCIRVVPHTAIVFLTYESFLAFVASRSPSTPNRS
eukprot:NODE_233_length_1765_cov_119.472028_g176_i0.p3 GENE.NODE_233_length_1765_cov_119.472028_g176_i0~~NODE_233_length_1765_cov_119.472028_g176_i0.p3  ORF type:complete len:108 (+),score=24.60 NODE_233_length_1765_cov_119.472028_g176_i0:697-1020(+)